MNEKKIRTQRGEVGRGGKEPEAMGKEEGWKGQKRKDDEQTQVRERNRKK